MRRTRERAISVPSEPWERQSFSRYFVIVGVLLLASMACALWDEVYTRRPWKRYQRDFFTLARRKYAEDLAEAKRVLASDEYKQLRRAYQAAVQRYEKNPTVLATRAEIAQLEKQLAEVRSQLQLVRGDYQALIYVMEHTKDEGKKRSLYQRVTALEREVNPLLAKMEDLQERKRKAQNKLIELAAEKDAAEKKMAPYEARLREAELGLEAIQKEPIKLRQVFNQELKVVDRCQSCHVAADRKGFTDKLFAHPFRSHPDVFFLPAAAQGEAEAAPKDKKEKKDTNAQSKPPRVLNILAVHPVEKFGCTPCHRGQGFAASSVKDAHGEVEFVTMPLLRGEFAQATCLKCHQQETELKGAPVLNEGRRLAVEHGCIGCHAIAQLTPEETDRQIAPDLRELRKKLVSSQWLVDWIEKPTKFRPTTKMPHFYLTRQQAEQIAAYLWQNADKPPAELEQPASFPPNVIAAGKKLFESVGCLACHSLSGKKGEGDFAPNLARIGEKMRYDYMVSWLMDPKKHQPNGLMPSLRLTRQEASNIAAYLTTQRSNAPTFQRSNASLDDPLKARQGKTLIEHYGCFGCHPIKGMEGRSKIGAELSQFGSKPVELLDYGLLEEKVLHTVGLHHARHNTAKARIAWVMQKLRAPRSYDEGRYKEFKDKLRMPKFNFTEKQIRAVTTFLMGLTDEQVPPNWQKRLDEREAAIARGLRIIRRQNCIGCHQFQLENLTFARYDKGEQKIYHLEGLTTTREEGNIYFQLWKEVPGLEGGEAGGSVEVPEKEVLVHAPGLGGDVVPLIVEQVVAKTEMEPEEARALTPPILIGEGRKVQSPWLFE
ncbi:MAG: c-type cytochrome, partial [Abditibacteriales bacterium]|nr:c-type cytochrome [Abditibacteriales bacterium]MDW8366772.1 c-type cytochrome [Abditibacteriales bacterium]